MLPAVAKQLYSTPDNSLPPDAVCDLVRTRDAVTLRHARWRTIQPPCKGTVVILQGRGEFIEKYFETISELRQNGFDVLAFDWRGQGGSARMLADPRKGYVDSFRQYETDLDTIMEQVALPDCRSPYYLLAHSMGALVALYAGPRLGNRVRRMALLSPFAGFGEMPVPHGLLAAACGVMAAVGLGGVYVSGSGQGRRSPAFSGNLLTSDSRRFTRNQDFAAAYPDLAIGAPTASWISASARAIERVSDPDHIGDIAIPSLLIAAGLDRIVSNRAIEDVARRLRSGGCLTVDGARHELLQEADRYREQALAAVLAFLSGGTT
jgi:lysophospholipase